MAISDRDRKLLWGRSRNLCAFPQCRQPLTADQLDAATGKAFHIVVGEQAHIRSSSPDGPRYDATYPADMLDSYENHILLCPVHHTKIDADGGRAFDAKTLVEMRTTHEQQEERRQRMSEAIRAYLAEQFDTDDKVLFEQVEMNGPRVDAMFVDVPFASRQDTNAGQLLARIAAEHPGDADSDDGYAVAGAAQALLHPAWSGNALLVGGPGQGKSTLLQYVCQYHRARRLRRDDYTGKQQRLKSLTNEGRIPIRLDLRKYALWAAPKEMHGARTASAERSRSEDSWRSIEQYITDQIEKRSGGHTFSIKDLALLVSTEPVLLAFDGLDEVANLAQRDHVSQEIVRTNARLSADARDLVVLVATRPGVTTSPLWSSQEFPVFHLRRLTAGLRLQYLQRWCSVAGLSAESACKLQQTFLENENLPHIRELASFPMQLAILLHLLQRRKLLPQQRTELYREYLRTFLDREQTEDKEPLLSTDREVIEDIHAFLGWYLQKRSEDGKSARTISRPELKKLLEELLDGREKGQTLATQLFSAMETRVLCLIEREPGFFQFEVQSLQEYFAAAYMFEHVPTKGEGNSRDDCLNALLERPYWSNVCRFFVGMFSKVEVRGIRQNLLGLSAKPELARHPHLRMTAEQLLGDRTYQGQPDTPIREIVDFVLDGPGVVLADDGFLDDSGAPFTLSEDAGRLQAVHHLKARLVIAAPGGVRHAVARILRRHAIPDDDLGAWWWSRFEPTADWLRIAAELGVLGGVKGQRATDLAALVSECTTEDSWTTDLLARGNYDGRADDVLAVCMREINDGAADVLADPRRGTDLGRLVDAARTALLRRDVRSARLDPEGSTARTRLRRTAGRSLVPNLVACTNSLRSPPDVTSNAEAWASRISQIGIAWGDGWVLRQAVALIPLRADVAAVASAADKKRLASAALQREVAARDGRGDTSWWKNDLDAASSDWERRFWVFSLLATAHSRVVIDLADELNEAVATMAPKSFHAIEATLGLLRPVRRKLVIQDALRLGQVSFTPRTLWLLRNVSTESSVEQIGKRLAGRFEELLAPGLGDMRPLLHLIGGTTPIKIDVLRGTRAVLPGRGWTGAIKLGVINASMAAEILDNPQDWPIDAVDLAIQRVARQFTKTPPISTLAETKRWFQTS